MNKSYLYSLPKDLLIELITTIEEKTRKEYEPLVAAFEDFNNKVGLCGKRIRKTKCNHDSCEEVAYLVEIECDYYVKSFNTNNVKFAYCEFCYEDTAEYPIWCSQHVSQYLIGLKEDSRYSRPYNICKRCNIKNLNSNVDITFI